MGQNKMENNAEAAGKVVIVVGGWVGSWQLADVQILVSIASGTLVAIYTAVQLYFLLRDKFWGKKDEDPSS